MGFFQRLRVASGTRDRSDKSASPSSPDTSRSESLAPGEQHTIRRSTSTNLLRGSKSPKLQPTHPPSSNSGRSSALPWQKKRDDFSATPYEATAVNQPVRARAPSIPIPTIATYESTSRATTPTTSNSRPSVVTSVTRPLPAPPTSPTSPISSVRNGHARTSSEATVISLTSTFTGRSRRSSDTSQEWKKEGGILGTLAFEQDDWGGLGGPGAKTAMQAPEPQQPLVKRRYPPPANSSAIASALSSPTKQLPPVPVHAPAPAPKTAGMKKLGVALNSPSMPALNTKLDMPSPPRDRSAGPVSTPNTPGRDKEGERLEEIRTSEADDDRKMWRIPLKVRRTSRSSSRTEAVRPPSPTIQRRPASQAIDRPNPPRRPSSSLFHNPFQRAQSRTSLAFTDDTPPPVDDGSFVVRSFRHVSGVSGAKTVEGDYLAQGNTKASTAHAETLKSEPPTELKLHEQQQRKNSFPMSSPQRPRPPSAAGSIDSAPRVSAAAFRKNVRRPSSNVVLDDEDDLPLSLSRANLRDAGMRRDSSALSLTEGSPHLKVTALAPGSPASGSGAASPSSLATRSPIPSTRPSIDATSSENRRSLVVKGVQSTRQSPDSRSSDARRTPKQEASPPPTVQRMSSPPANTGFMHRPDRKSSLPALPPSAAQKGTPPRVGSPSKAFVSSDSAPQVPAIPDAYSPQKNDRLSVSQSSSHDTEVLENIKLPPRPYELPDEFPRPSPYHSRPPSRGSTLSPVLTGVLDEPLKRISGFWSGSGTPQDDGKEEAFDPALAQINGLGLTERDRTSSFGNLNRQSFYDRLSAATSGVTNAVGSVAAIVSPSVDTSGERLYIPPVPDSDRQLTIVQFPESDRSVSPAPVPPPMKEPPAPPPMVSHSSFGRVPKAAVGSKASPRAKPGGWADSSSEDETDKTPPARRVLKTSTAAANPPPRAAPGGPRQRVPSITGQSTKNVVVLESDSEEETLRNIRAKASSRSELRPPMSSSSTSSLKSAMKAPKKPSPPLKQSATMTPSASNWSLSTTSPSPEASPGATSGASGPPSRPASRLSRPGSRANMRRIGSADRLSQLNPTERPAMNRAASSDRLSVVGRVSSSDRLNGGAPRSILRDSSPRHSTLLSTGDKIRQTASPASTQSGLTGDSAAQQPMTPRSTADSRRSWAEGRPRVASESAERPRPSTIMDQWPGASAAPQAYPYGPGMEMYAAAAAQAHAYGQPNLAQYEAMKHQMQVQWMAAAQRNFEDAWERASSVSNAQTAPNGPGGPGGFQQTYGYSYQQPMPPMPQMYPPQMYGFPGGGYPYYGGAPQAPFPGMPMPPMTMGSMGMPVAAGGMFSYGNAAQSVYGGEFGPPVHPSQQAPPSPNSPQQPQRARRSSGATELGNNPNTRRVVPDARPSSIASHTGVRRPLPQQTPRRSRPRAGSPPTSWHDIDETPRPKRVTNAS